MWLSEVEVDVMLFHELQALLPFFCWYSQPVMAPPPLTEAVRSSLPVPARAADGLAGLPGLVRNAAAVASLLAVVQVLPLNAS